MAYEYGSGIWGATADGSVVTETYSFGGRDPINGGLRIGFRCENRTPSFFDTSAQGGFEFSVLGSTGVLACAGLAFLADYNDVPTTITQAAIAHSFVGMNMINDNAPNPMYYWDANSSATNRLYGAPNGIFLTNTTTYIANHIIGSISNYCSNITYLSDVISTQVGFANFNTSLICVIGVYGQTTVNTRLETARFSIGFYDNIRKKTAEFHTGLFGGTLATFLTGHSKKNIITNPRINPDGQRVQIEVGSSNASTTTLLVTSNFNTIPSTMGIRAVGVRFGDDHGFKIGVIGFNVNTNTGSSYIQTNSVLPRFYFGMASNVKTPDYIATSANPEQSFSFGHWSHMGQGNGIILAYSQVGSTYFENAVDGLNIHFFRTGSGGNTANQIGIRTMEASSNQLFYNWSTTTPTVYNGALTTYLIHGDSTNAPDHLMDASSSSIFLADASDYDDNLLLVGSVAPSSSQPGSGGGGSVDLTGGALFRTFPTTDNREFPIPLTNVRAFPSD